MIWLKAKLHDLTMASGHVAGAAFIAEGKTRQVSARKGVVLATGGFGGSVES